MIHHLQTEEKNKLNPFLQTRQKITASFDFDERLTWRWITRGEFKPLLCFGIVPSGLLARENEELRRVEFVITVNLVTLAKRRVFNLDRLELFFHDTFLSLSLPIYRFSFLSPEPNDPWSMHGHYAHTQFRFWIKFWNFNNSPTWVFLVWLRTREGQQKLRNWKLRFLAWNPVTSSLVSGKIPGLIDFPGNERES